MLLYAPNASRRTRQIIFDALVTGWTIFSIWAGKQVYDLVDRLGGPGRFLQESSPDVSDRSRNVPGLLRGPVDALDGAINGIGGGMRKAGAAQVEAAHDLAVVLGVLIALLMCAVVLVRYLPSRVKWVQEATAVETLRHSSNFERLLAQRAVINQPLPRLARVSHDPVGDLATGQYEALANLELHSLGVPVRKASKTEGD